MSGSPNIRAYEDIEKLSSYASREALLTYRNARVRKYAAVIEFMRSRSANPPLSVLEIGSGSSALLYGLVARSMLNQGMGVELSRTRFQFAEQWKKDECYDTVKNLNANFTEVNMGTLQWDWFVVIDNTFTYLHPESADYPTRLLQKAYDSLKVDGRLLIDFINYAKRVPEFDHLQWVAFSPTDPYSYGLYLNRIKDGINYSESIFIKRDGSESRKSEHCKVYSLEELATFLLSCGFEVLEACASFDGDPFVPHESERLVVVARKFG